MKNNTPSYPLPILILDDDEVILLAIEEIVTDAGFEVVTTSSPTTALEEMQNQSFAIIISDQRMPEMTGIEFLSHSMKVQPNAIRILTTGVLHIETVIAAVNESHVFKFLPKPWMRNDFVSAIEEAYQEFDKYYSIAQLAEDTLKINEELSERLNSIDAS